jgi:hypothetical protein
MATSLPANNPTYNEFIDCAATLGKGLEATQRKYTVE